MIVLILTLVFNGILAWSPFFSLQRAEALLGNYGRLAPAGRPLDYLAWNYLDQDFLAVDGSNIMLGDIDMAAPGHGISGVATPANTDLTDAANIDYIVSQSAGVNQVVCSSFISNCTTNTGQVGCWQKSGPRGVKLIVPTNTGLPSVSMYFATISGPYTYVTYSPNNLYSVNPTSFQIYLQYYGELFNYTIRGWRAPCGIYNTSFISPQAILDIGSICSPSYYPWTVYWCAISG